MTAPTLASAKTVQPTTANYSFTVEDPKVWTKPWSGEYTWRATNQKVYEYACHEGNYSMGGILRGARLLEQDLLDGNLSLTK